MRKNLLFTHCVIGIWVVLSADVVEGGSTVAFKKELDTCMAEKDL